MLYTCTVFSFSDGASGGGRWSDYGCYLVKTDEGAEGDISCYCNHTTNFAVLMQVVDSAVSIDPLPTAKSLKRRRYSNLGSG